ncbi:hypothetical protein IFM89_001522 [Coptis chinensis]|uniref:F-box protein n=1 Tax=Coptis chinensis TaxID=261450 RepID=A0A835HY28_9MAGN|nr:hypothetical protein IFM89_001522 [Coptis chinensis]
MLVRTPDKDIMEFYHAQPTTASNDLSAVYMEFPVEFMSYEVVGIRNGLMCLASKLGDALRVGGTGLWTTLDPISYDIIFSSTALVNGYLHWVTMRTLDSVQFFIVCFDINDKVFREIPLPKCLSDDTHDSKRAVVLGGLL